MARCRLLILVILLEVLQVVYCGNDSYNPFSPINKKSELRASILPDDKELFFRSNEDTSDEKLIEKRRLFFKDGEMNPAGRNERDDAYDDFPSRRKTNYSEIETAVQISEQNEGHNNWDSRQNRFSVPTERVRNFPEFQSRQPWVEQQHPNQQFNWEHRNNFFENTQSRWNEEKNFREFENLEFHPREGNTYNGRPTEIYQDSFNANPVRNGDVFNRRMSITTLNEPKNYHNGRVGEMNPSYLGNPNTHYYNRNLKGFWNPHVYRPDKGVIINFNTECPAPRQLNNQLVHKFIYTQKPPLSVESDIDFPVPESSLIAAHKMAPMYYL